MNKIKVVNKLTVVLKFFELNIRNECSWICKNKW